MKATLFLSVIAVAVLSSAFLEGYRDGAIKANADINDDSQKKIDANVLHIKCPPDTINADWCPGYKYGYSDEAMDLLDENQRNNSGTISYALMAYSILFPVYLG